MRVRNPDARDGLADDLSTTALALMDLNVSGASCMGSIHNLRETSLSYLKIKICAPCSFQENKGWSTRADRTTSAAAGLKTSWPVQFPGVAPQYVDQLLPGSWAVRYPDMVKRPAPIAGTAKNTIHDSLFHGNPGRGDHLRPRLLTMVSTHRRPT